MRKLIITPVVFIIICLITYVSTKAIMIKSIKNVKTDFYNVVCGQKEISTDYGLLIRYDHSDEFQIKTVDNLNLDIDGVWHNSKEGYMNVRYSFDINKGSQQSTGASKVHSKWYIRREGNRWIVYDIDEAP